MLGKLVYLNQVGLVSVCAKFQLCSLFRSSIKVPGGGVWWGVVGCSGVGRPILVFSLSLSQAEQYIYQYHHYS